MDVSLLDVAFGVERFFLKTRRNGGAQGRAGAKIGRYVDFSKYEEALVDYSGTLGEHINVVITTLSNMAHEAFKVSFDSFAPAVSTFINDTLPVIIEIFT